MSDNRKHTSYCGLYCKDCIPSHTELYELTERLAGLLDNLGFEHYAELKSQKIKEFENYPIFRKLLSEIRKLQCKPTCFEGPVSKYGCNADCKMRQCVLERGFAGCWDCDEHKTCEKLAWHKSFHPGIEHNLELIKKFGLDNWVNKRGKHYPWK